MYKLTVNKCKLVILVNFVSLRSEIKKKNISIKLLCSFLLNVCPHGLNLV